ncbi:MAG: fimbrillin family protein [Bacteroidales bacterium]|nr:fimbrillin family protein [Bacteroidales bacterium]
MLFSCIKDEPVTVLVDDGTVIFVGEDYQPATKTTLNGLQTEWVANTDKVGLFCQQASKTAGGATGVVNEPLTALTNGARSQFSGSVFWNTGDHTFYSYYPYAAGTPPHTAVPVSLKSNQGQLQVNNSDSLAFLDFLVAQPYTAKYPGSNSTPAAVSLRYNHLFSIIEFQIKRTTGSGSIKKVRLRGTAPLAFGSGTINLAQSVPASGTPYMIESMTNTSKSVTVELKTAFTPSNVEYLNAPKVYMVVLPGVHTGELNIGFEINGVYYEVSRSNVIFERGKKYTIQVDVYGASKVVVKGSELEPVTVGDLIWAPINVGYREDLKQGELFQWGRKYGFGLSVAEAPTSNKNASEYWNYDLDQETAQNKYKDVFLKAGTDPYDWNPVRQLEWNSSQKFNPCPIGWRVPTKTELTTLLSYGFTNIGTTNGGVDDLLGKWIGPNHDNPELRPTTAVFFPIIGYFTASSTGSRTNFTSHAIYWTSTTPAAGPKSADYMQFTTSTSNPVFSYTGKAFGYAVRCVKDVVAQDKPIISTIKPFEVKYNSAKTGVVIENAGGYPIIERGIVYNTGTTVDPTGNKRIALSGGPNEYVVEMTGLTASSTYIVRSYVVNSLSQIFYGDQYRLATIPNWEGSNEVNVGGIIWAPVNAGYSTSNLYGLMYQWSRMYGQTYDNSESPASSNAAPTNISTANNIGNSNKFYVPTVSPFDCFTARASNWSHEYNPCPLGWRVPTKEEFDILISSGSTWVSSGVNGKPGRWFGGNHATDKVGSVFLPAAGMRSYNGDIGGLRTTWGTYWTATPSGDGNFADALFFTETISPYTEGGRYRAVGNSIRCVK